MKKVVVLSPSRFSLYTICVVELLERQNIHVSSIIVRKLFNPKRFVSEFSRDGSRLLKKIWKKLILRKSGYTQQNYETIIDLMKENNISTTKVDDFRKKYGSKVLYCTDLNEPCVVETLKASDPDIVVFTGGGLIRKEVLDNSGAGILNCHMGILPPYRGMDVVEWPMLEGNFDQVGTTVHFMDQGVDTGDILQTRQIEIVPGETIKQLRDRFEPIMCREMVNTCKGYLDGQIQRCPQKAEDGKQYFIMHPSLIEVTKSKLKSAYPN